MWEEYAVPGLIITFTLGVLLGINLGILCVPRFFEPQCTPRGLAQPFVMKEPPQPAPMRYPSGFTAKQLQQHDFTRRPLGHGSNIIQGRRQGGSFNY